MTLNQAIDDLSQVKSINLSQLSLKLSLKKFKKEFGGRTKIENVKQIKNIIKYGDIEGENPSQLS